MLTENQVVDAVAGHLRRGGWEIERISHTNNHGPDILATKGDIRLVVEAKGGTSSKSFSKRFGKPFKPSQVLTHVSRALYAAAVAFSDDRYQPGIALPETSSHRTRLEQIRPALDALDITVFLVDEDGTVRELSHTARG